MSWSTKGPNLTLVVCPISVVSYSGSLAKEIKYERLDKNMIWLFKRWKIRYIEYFLGILNEYLRQQIAMVFSKTCIPIELPEPKQRLSSEASKHEIGAPKVDFSQFIWPTVNSQSYKVQIWSFWGYWYIAGLEAVDPIYRIQRTRICCLLKSRHCWTNFPLQGYWACPGHRRVHNLTLMPRY